ncbi:hypothetical protein [Methylocystis sp. S23]|jgi:hypothetical protein
MKRSFTSLGLTALGLSLAAAGVYAMWTGWDMILLERGWSLFIAGSVFLSGGAVTTALGRVVAHLARIAPGTTIAAEAGAKSLPAAAPAAPRPEIPLAKPDNSPKPDQAAERLDFTAILGGEPLAEVPTEVDQYTAGDATYVMMSDGSVEVRSSAGTQRYPSLAALRAEAESRQR